jgi:hypothetical protein
MTTHTDISKANQTIQLPAESRVSIGTVALVIILSLTLILITNSIVASRTSALSTDQRALNAWTSRYQRMADAYAIKASVPSQRALDAWAARHQGLADAYALKSAANSHRVMVAWIARYQGQANAYALKIAANQRANAASAARYQGMAELYTSGK